jgi:PqqD family protein of HPr-rel-A system
VEWRRLPDRLLVFAPATGALHTLNPVAGELFLLCDGRRSPAELARRLAARHGVTAGVARGWVGQGLAALDEAELLAAGGARNGR